MSGVRYVCVSDLHFGAANSLLTHVPPGGVAVDPSIASPCLKAFVDCLATLIGGNEDQSSKPELILNGDILEFALAPDNVAAMAFERFLELAFVQQKLFSRVHFLPGNHDHHLWETARERQYAAYVMSADGPLAPPWHATLMTGRSHGDVPVESELIDALMARHDLTMRPQVRYPTFGLFAADGTRGAIFHHGHYIEPIYTLMSRLQRLVFPDHPEGTEIWDWEATNFAWIDFFWSTLGRSGSWGSDVGLIYELLQSSEARQVLAGRLSGAATQQLPALIRPLARPVLNRLIRAKVANVKQLERVNIRDPFLSSEGKLGLRKLLEGPLAKQIRGENDGMLPRATSFVFGHTHKPFQWRDSYADYPGGIAVYNTGGWVVDEPNPDSQKGAAAVLLDEALNVATLRFYNQQPAAGGPVAVTVASVDPVDNPLYERLVQIIDPAAGPWQQLSTVVADEVTRRIGVLDEMIRQGLAALKGQP